MPFVESDQIIASRSSSGPITPEIMLAITLRMCAGGRQQDLRHRLYGVSRTSIYLTFHKVLEVIDHVESLFLPADDPEALADISSEFDRLTDGLLAGCVGPGAVDGYAISIIKPTSQYCSNPAFYFNRKGYYSLNMQAVCDSHRRFSSSQSFRRAAHMTRLRGSCRHLQSVWTQRRGPHSTVLPVMPRTVPRKT